MNFEHCSNGWFIGIWGIFVSYDICQLWGIFYICSLSNLFVETKCRIPSMRWCSHHFSDKFSELKTTCGHQGYWIVIMSGKHKPGNYIYIYICIYIYIYICLYMYYQGSIHILYICILHTYTFMYRTYMISDNVHIYNRTQYTYCI